MNTKDLIRLGVPEGPTLKPGMDLFVKFIGQCGDPSSREDCRESRGVPW